jgi:putative hydrolase of the HAD superfamily
MRAFDLVVFDLGGVLIRIASGWHEAHRLAGLGGAPPADRAFFAVLADLSKRADGSLSAAQFYERVASASGGGYSVEDARRISHAWLLGEYPGVGSVFDALESARLDTAVLSNTSDEHWSRLVPESGEPEFPIVLRARHRFASHLLGLVKPDRAIYRAVEERTGHAPERILFFDDLPENVSAAQASGWKAERIDPSGDTAAQMLSALRRHGALPQA